MDSVEVSDGVVIDYDSSGDIIGIDIVGIDIDQAKKKLNLKEL